jgi:O-antigen/teichoic acid export membrane protein
MKKMKTVIEPQSLDQEIPSADGAHPGSAIETAAVKLAKGGSISLGGAGVGRGIHTLGQIVIARLLGPEAFGLYAVGWTILRILSNVAQCGLSNGVIRYASMFKDSDQSKLKGVLLQSLGLTALASITVGGALFLSAPWLASTIFQKPELELVLRAFSIGIPLMALLVVAAAGTRASQRMQYSVYAHDLAQPCANLLLVVLFYLLGWRLLGAVAAEVLSIGLGLALALYYLGKLFPSFVSKAIKPSFITKELLSFSLPLLFVGFFGNLVMWTDILMIGYFRPAADAGIYRAAAQISVLFVLILWAFNSIFAPMIAELYYKRDLKMAHQLFKISTKWVTCLSLPPFLVIAFAPHELMGVLFGKDYITGALALVVLSSAQLFNAATGPVGSVLVMAGHQNVWLVNTVVAALVNIALNVIFIPHMGILGAAIATAASVVLLFLLGLIEAWVLLKMSPYDRRYWKVAVATLATVGSLLLFRQLQPSHLVVLVGASLLSLGTFVSTLVLMGLDLEEKAILRKACLMLGLSKRIGN